MFNMNTEKEENNPKHTVGRGPVRHSQGDDGSRQAFPGPSALFHLFPSVQSPTK